MKQVFFICLLGIALFACNKAPKDTVEASDVSTTLDSPDDLPGETLALAKDQTNCYIQYTGYKKIGTEESGKVYFQEGYFRVHEGKLVGGKFIVDLNTLTNESNNSKAMQQKFLTHMKSADFFEVETFPTAEFEIVQIDDLASPDDHGNTHTITGNMTIKGIDKQLVVPGKVSVKNGKVTMNTDFNFDRTTFGLNYGVGSNISKAAADEIISDAVNLKINACS